MWTHVGVGLGPSLLSFIQSHFYVDAFYFGGFPDISAVKNLPAMQREMQETRVHSLGREDPLEEEMATHFSILARKTSQSTGSQRVEHA